MSKKTISMDEYEQIDAAARKLKQQGFKVFRSETIESVTNGGPAIVRVRIYAVKPGFRSPPKVDVLVSIPPPAVEDEPLHTEQLTPSPA